MTATKAAGRHADARWKRRLKGCAAKAASVTRSAKRALNVDPEPPAVPLQVECEGGLGVSEGPSPGPESRTRSVPDDAGGARPDMGAVA
jgi:hypothetical protein